MLTYSEYIFRFERSVFMDWRLILSIVVVIASLAGLVFSVKNKKPKAGWIATLIVGIYGAIVFSI
jgi:uncharacterized membrane protein YeaQ/YmgE (transglycosylase-associated protein family)